MAQKLTLEDLSAPFLGAVLRRRDPGQPRSLTVRGVTTHSHRVIVTDFQYYPARMEQFGITERLKESWERSGTEIYLDILLEGETVRELRVLKSREDGACARPCSRDLKPTDQELRIVRRVLEHLTRA